MNSSWHHIPRGTIQIVVSLQTQVPGCSVTQTTSPVCGAAVRCIALQQQQQALFAWPYKYIQHLISKAIYKDILRIWAKI